ncbi:MAG: hypothetical protein H6933_15970 [Burkholderiaceae bacterium]|nr:hypothetical protein [Rhodoferax sp.]MCP5285545.1 hypothetical protein [Burkholderiaceae bacterium]MCP5286384.1 hypothetical protein [Burkholderiaceae bacterium]
MHQKKRIPSIASVIVAIGLGAAWPAWGLGFGSGTPSTTLGRPLDFRVVLRLADGESLDDSCVRAAVLVGDRNLPAQAIGTLVTTGPDNTAVVRVRTTSRIDEPLVSVDVQAGCVQRVSRSYTVFADPPLSPLPAVPEQLARAPVPAGQPAAAADAVPAAPAVPQPAVTPVPQVAVRAAAPTAEVVASAATPRPAPKPKPRPKPRPKPKVVAQPDDVQAPPAARLRLDEPRVVLPASTAAAGTPTAVPGAESAETLLLVDRANEAVKAAIAAASASQARIAALEDSVRQLSDAARDQQRLLAQLSARAEAAESGARWLWPLLLAIVAFAGLATWLWIRLRELERERHQGWLAAAQAAASPRAAVADRPAAAAAPAQRAEVPTPSQVPLLVERGQRHGGLGAVGAGLAPVHQPTPSEMPDPAPTQPPAWYDDVPPSQRTMPLVSMPAPAIGGVPAGAAVGSSRDVSAEELIDLEQQAEFFVVLGQDDAAIDLLVSHLRDAGGASPLPYLKLLDIYHRREDRAAYERTRDRFNQRFNAHAPAWDAAGHDGRALEDYPAVIDWLQRVWPQPLDAMAELESLLFRKDGGELFDLPAYRELLMLYALARDLLESTSGGGASVDVLLPLNDAPGFVQTSPRPYFGDDEAPPEVQPTAPLDLDLGPTHDESVIERRR